LRPISILDLRGVEATACCKRLDLCSVTNAARQSAGPL